MRLVREAFEEMYRLQDDTEMRMVEAFNSPKAFLERYQISRDKKSQVDQWKEFISAYDKKHAAQIEAFELARVALEKLKHGGRSTG
jgi:hypothetical protein